MVNRLNRALRAQILHLLCEGSSMRSVHRVLGISRQTIAKLLVDAGQACPRLPRRARAGPDARAD